MQFVNFCYASSTHQAEALAVKEASIFWQNHVSRGLVQEWLFRCNWLVLEKVFGTPPWECSMIINDAWNFVSANISFGFVSRILNRAANWFAHGRKKVGALSFDCSSLPRELAQFFKFLENYDFIPSIEIIIS